MQIRYAAILGLFVSLICFMQTRTMQCLCDCKITRVTIIRTPQQVQPAQAPIAPALQSMEESQRQAEPSSVRQAPIVVITPNQADVPGSVSEEIVPTQATPA